MKSPNHEDLPEYSLSPAKMKKGGSSGGWGVAVLAMAAAGGAGYYAYTQHARTSPLRSQVTTLNARVTDSDAKVKDLTAKLEQAETERASLAAAKEELSKNVASKDEELSKLKGTYDQLQSSLKGELKSGDIQLIQAGGKLRVALVDKLLFNSGEAMISKRGDNVLMRVGKILAAIPDKQITVSGHTDTTPISQKKLPEFPTNWELSVTRATNVVRFLQEKAGVPGERLTASGYGEYHPVASNKSSSGRARNRRIEILLTPELHPKAVAKSTLKKEANEAAATTAESQKTPPPTTPPTASAEPKHSKHK
jgi:chemotaxis protein MotB